MGVFPFFFRRDLDQIPLGSHNEVYFHYKYTVDMSNYTTIMRKRLQSHSPAEFHVKKCYINLLLPNSKENDIWQEKHSYFLDTITRFYSFCGNKSIAFTNEQAVALKDWSLLTSLCIFLLILAYILTRGKKSVYYIQNIQLLVETE